MINQLITLFFRRRHLAWVIAILVTCYGYYSWKMMAVEAYPDISDLTVQVTTQVPGLAAEEVEQQITTPLERALSNTPGVVTIRSSSTFALSLITMVFNGSDNYFVRQRVLERIAGVTLPAGVQPGLNPVSSPSGEIYRYTLESDSKNLMELSEIQRWIVIPGFKQVSGIADVNNFGGFTKEFRLELDPIKLQQYGVVLNDVVSAINSNSANAGGGRIARGEQSYVVRGIGQIHSLDDLGTVAVKQSNGTPILIKDLGKLSFGHQEREGILGKDRNPDTLEGIVLMLKSENPSRVLEGVHAKVAEMQKQLAPMGVKIVPYIDRDDLVELTVHKVAHTVIEGVGLVLIVLILFLGSPRSAIVAAVAIPAALVAVFIMMNLSDMPANLFSLGAIDFGIIVDGAIVVMEAVLKRREEQPNDELTEQDILETLSYVGRPIFFATLIIITAYLPLFAFERAEGKLFTPMAYTVGYALLGALICVITLIPGLAFTALRKPRKVFVNRPLIWLTRHYQRILVILLARPSITYVIAGISLIAVVALGATTGKEFLPDIDEGALWLQVQLPSGISLDKSSEMATDLRRTLLKYPEVSYVVTQLGRNDDGTDPWTPSHIEAPIGLKPYSEWPNGETKAAFINQLNTDLKKLPGFDIGISQPIIDGVNDAVGGAHSPLVLRIYGPDLKESRRIGNQVVDILDTIRGTASASLFQEPPIPQVVIKVDRAASARFGVNVADIIAIIQTGVGSAPIMPVYVDDKIYNVTVGFPKNNKSSPASLGSLLLNSSTGAKIPLSQVTTIKLQTGESTISHEHGERQITVRIDNRGRDLTSYLAEAQARINKEVKLDTALYRFEWAGQFESQRRAEKRLAFILALVLILMGALLFFQFGKIRQALLILGIVPLATLGGLIALHVTGNTLNVASAVGFIALFGVSVQNGIIMVANFRRIKGEGLPLNESVIVAATERLRPVLMTATVASIGMLPAALATGVGTDVQRNLATVVVGGLIVSTLLTLFILPVFYYAMEHLFEKRKWSLPRLRRNR
ncbi:efflux RND transporter permease subunit [Aquirhabdus sp.]|uniref:efflux RND transporter permease subunit n=1 Tax=Aquirhabdus sp. TaxID=2824160 RepID=UPI00396CFEE5